MKNIEDYKLLMVGNWRLRSAKENFLEKLKKEKMDNNVILKEGVSESELLLREILRVLLSMFNLSF